MRIAVAQLSCVPVDIDANVEQMAALAKEAAQLGAELVVYPELALTGYEPDDLAHDPTRWTHPKDPRLTPLRTAGIATVVNGVAATENGPAITTFVFGPDGDLLTTYRKQHLYAEERWVFTPGNTDGRFELGGVRFGLATCYDNHFPELTARAHDDDCDVLLASSLYGSEAGMTERATVYPAIAERDRMFVALANHVGAAGEWIGCGRSAIWAAGGELLAEADGTSAMVVAADIG